MLRKNIILIVILLIAFVLRINKLDYLELFGDEVDAGYQSYSLMTTGKDYMGNKFPLYAQSFSEWRAPMMMYSMIPFIKLFGLNEIGVRSYSVFFGMLSIIGFYVFLLSIGSKKNIALLSSFFIAISPWHIQYSRSGFEITLLSALIFWGLYLLIESLDRPKFWKILLTSIVLSCSFYTYNTANIYVPLLLVLIFVLNYIYTKKSKFGVFFVLLSIMFLMSIPILMQIFFGHGAERFKKFSVYNNDGQISEIIRYRESNDNSFISKIFYNKPVFAAKKIFANYTNAFSSDFLFGMGDVTFRHSIHKVGNLFWCYLIFIVGFIYIFKNKTISKADAFIIGLLLIAPVPASLTIDGYNHATRLFLLLFPISYLVSVGILSISKYKPLLLIFSLILISEFSYFQFYYWTSYKNESWRWWHYGYKEMVKSVENIKNDYNVVYVENTYEPSLIRYLFWTKKKPFSIKDNMVENGAGKLNGFCIDNKTCFVNYNGKIDTKLLDMGSLYIISHEKNVGGDWDWSKDPPENIKTIKKIVNPLNEPIFYLITRIK